MQPVHADTSSARRNLAALLRIFAHLGFDDLLYTHCAARNPERPDHLLMNPQGLLFEEVQASTLVELPLAPEPPPGGFNLIGYRLHAALLRAVPEARCTIHLHTPAGVAVSSQAGGLLPLSQPAMLLTGQIAFHENEGLTFEPGETERLVRAMGDKRVMFLRNHGTVVWGRSFAEAFELAYNLERACDTQVRALAGQPALALPPPGIAELTQRQYAGFGHPDDDSAGWQAVLRKVERLDPNYAR